MAHRTQRLLRTGLVAVCVSTVLLAVVLWPLEELHQRRAELVEDGAYGLATDAAKFKGLEAEISTAQAQNDDLQQGLKSSLGAAEPSSSRVNPNPDWASDYLSSVASHEGVVGQDPGCCGGDDDASQPEPGTAGDVSIGAVIQQMSRKLRAMKQKFREIQASYYHGDPRVIDLKVKPRGPRGFTGDPGEKGPPGDKGAKGAVGPVGPKGRTGYKGETGVQGRKGAKGMTGSIGEAGDKGNIGPVGDQGDPGYPGPPGARGPPGAAGVMGANGKDGPPGPPGSMGPEGPRGEEGARGSPGPNGANGPNGNQGPRGGQGQTGPTGEPGTQGQPGPPGPDGVGPPQPAAQRRAGTGTWGPWYTATSDCTKLGIKENLGGECKPLCEFCDSAAGFKLVNPDGLRYKDLSFDDRRYSAGETQPLNACMLARYGNKGQITLVPEDSSYFKASIKASVKKQANWFGGCPEGSDDDAQCCSNAKLLQDGFDWTSFAKGSTCQGTPGTSTPASQLVCIFDKAEMDRQMQPPAPPVFPADKLVVGGLLSSSGSKDKTCIMSPNGFFRMCLRNSGNIKVLGPENKELWSSETAGKGAGGPYKLQLTSADLILSDKDGVSVWSSGAKGQKRQLALGDDGVVILRRRNGQSAWQAGEPQTLGADAELNLAYNKAVCIADACISGANWKRLAAVSRGLLLSGESSLRPGKRQRTASFTPNFGSNFGADALAFSYYEHSRLGGAPNTDLSETQKTKNSFIIKADTADGASKTDVSWVVASAELAENAQVAAPRGPTTGDRVLSGRMCVGRQCTDQGILARLADVSNAKILTGRKTLALSSHCNSHYYDCNCRANCRRICFFSCWTSCKWRFGKTCDRCSTNNQVTSNSVRLNFNAGFSDAPLVVAWITGHEFCGGQNGQGMVSAWVTETSKSGATINVNTDNVNEPRVKSIQVDWMAISPELSRPYRPYYALVASSANQIFQKVCVGSFCADATKWGQMMSAAQWSVQRGDSSVNPSGSCSSRTTTKRVTVNFKYAFAEPPKLVVGMGRVKHCGANQDWNYKLEARDVTTTSFTLQIEAKRIVDIRVQWVAYSKSLSSNDQSLKAS